MKTRLIVILALLGIFSNSIAQQSPNWEKWDWLIGEWKGEGSGQPGQGGGTVNTKFEMSQDGENFATYIEGVSSRNGNK